MDPSNREDSCDIAIVGGGCSGVLTAANLLRRGWSGRLSIVEPRDRLGRGLAYSTYFPEHLLNVPAGKMSAFPERPLHFVEWLHHAPPNRPAEGLFAQRMVYGAYLEHVLRSEMEANPHAACLHVRAEVTTIEEERAGMLLTLSCGRTIPAGRVVLALGNPLSSSFPGIAFEELGAGWYASPWQEDALKVRFPGERILLIGTGLTATDAALALQGQALQSRTWMISRRGILPRVHAGSCTPSALKEYQWSNRAGLLIRQIRKEIVRLNAEGICWRVVLDALRPRSNQLWSEMPIMEQRRFLRHLKPYWEPHRHRMAPAVLEPMARFLREDRVRILAGRIQGISACTNSLDVQIRLRTGRDLTFSVDRIINCTGIQERYDGPLRRPLIHSLIENGLAEANNLGIGFRTDGAGALVTAKSGVSRTLFTLGPPRRGELFETTAVPEIRVQAESLARRLMENR